MQIGFQGPLGPLGIQGLRCCPPPSRMGDPWLTYLKPIARGSSRRDATFTGTRGGMLGGGMLLLF